ncbi:MAG: glutamate-1-semialdehyde 2,1-aminomutase [Eubacteriales bacterium]|nr:glutamate-1-semialdehyde 2,1-aminomutase [Eubacteriales bacterium]
MSKSENLFKRALLHIPGGVNSPVRAFGAVGGTPPFIQRANGAYLYDVDGNSYLDFVNSWGAMILGHNHPAVRESVEKVCKDGLSFGAVTELEVEMAELICDLVPSIEMVRMVNSGTEAVMSAIRLARGYTGKNKIIKFSGCYHGHSDALLVKAGSGLMTGGIPDSAGITSSCARDTITIDYNDFEQLERAFNEADNDIAALIIEPIAANMGLVLPKDGFLEKIQELCKKNDVLLIFDEVITGFRIGLDGAQGLFGIEPDITTFGKIIGAGLPVGAFGGKKEIMLKMAPVGNVYQAGTLSGNPVAMAAGLAQLNYLKNHKNLYTELKDMGDYFYGQIEKLVNDKGFKYPVNHVGSLGCMFFSENQVQNYDSAKESNIKIYAKYFHFLLGSSIYMTPSQFETMFISAAHSKDELNSVLDYVKCFFESIVNCENSVVRV